MLTQFLIFATSWLKVIWPVFGIVLACAAVVYFATDFRNKLFAAGVAALAIAAVGIYGKGRYDQRADDRAVLKIKIERAVKTGRAAEAEALRKFDNDPGFTDPFERKDERP